MNQVVIKKGLTIPIKGEPSNELSGEIPVKTVALIGPDYPSMKPTMLVKIGDRVKLGQPVFEDKKCKGITYTSPTSGVVKAVHRGEKRVFLSVVIEIDGTDEITFDTYTQGDLTSIKEEEVRKGLQTSGLWTALRQRPFNIVARPEETPHSIFVTAIDTNPLAPDISLIIKDREKDFKNGLTVLSKLTQGNIHVCVGPDSTVPIEESDRIKGHVFKGKHPAGLVGTHIHFIDPVGRKKTVWHIGIQDVIAYGQFFTTGRIPTDRIVSIGGPGVTSPKVVKTRLGASTKELTSELTSPELKAETNTRIVSGSVLSGKNATEESLCYLGRYDQSICVLKEGDTRDFLGMVMPGANKYSIKNVFLSKLFMGKKYAFTTSVNGSKRAMVPVGSYESVMPLDMVPTYLLRAIIVGDLDRAVDLGALELAEEDLGLCTFVCPSKYDYGTILRDNLTTIEKEG